MLYVWCDSSDVTTPDLYHFQILQSSPNHGYVMICKLQIELPSTKTILLTFEIFFKSSSNAAGQRKNDAILE